MQEFPATYVHEIQISIPMYLVDPGNVVYHSRYLDLYHDARDQFLAAAGYPYSQVMMENCHLAVVEATQKYRMPLFYLETATIRTRVAWIRNRSMGFVQEMVKTVDGNPVVCNEAILTLVCVSSTMGQSSSIPEKLVAAISEFQNPK